LNPRDFKNAILEIIGCGGDTDTTAAILGGIVGTAVGPAGIPDIWMNNPWEWPRTIRWMRQLGQQFDMMRAGKKLARPFKAAVTKQQWRASMGAYRKPLGQLITRTLKSKTYATSLPGAPDGEYVVIQYATTFENKKSAIETITPMLDEDGKWRVSGYYIK
jgi:hypothetical protein